MRIFRYDTLDSTNSEAARRSDDLAHGDVIVARQQSSGRGQRGNTWESQPGKNLTFSVVLFSDNLSAKNSFLLSMAVSVSIVEALREAVNSRDIVIKWPNDIYFNDKKIAGILIENTVCAAKIKKSIIGIGLNVNQKAFLSDAPNPFSLCQIVGRELPLDEILESVVRSVVKASDLIEHTDNLVEKYQSFLWRRTGLYKWHEPDGEIFEASIRNVDTDGHLNLVSPSGQIRRYAFKEIIAHI